MLPEASLTPTFENGNRDDQGEGVENGSAEGHGGVGGYVSMSMGGKGGLRCLEST